MHILFISGLDVRGGEARSLYQLITQIRDKVQASIVLPCGSPLVEKYQSLGCKVYQVHYHSCLQSIPSQKWKLLVKYPSRLAQYLVGKFGGVSSISRQINMTTVDIIHANSSREDLGALLAQKYHKPIIWHLREFGDLDYPCYSYRRDYVRFMDNAATEFIAISDAVREHWVKKGLSAERIVRIYNGVDTNVQQKDYRKKNNDGIVRFLIIGFLSEAKGQHELISAIGLLPESIKGTIQLDIVGGYNSSYFALLKATVGKMGLENTIHFLGYDKDIANKVWRYDCGFMCSRSEGFGRVTVEYMMAGLPVIASDSGANSEIVKDGKNGLLYQQGNLNDRPSHPMDRLRRLFAVAADRQGRG